MTPLQAVILGLVEGITEYLPVSSTGHLILAAALMGMDESPQQLQAVHAFEIVIQGGAILAVLGLYRSHVLRMIRGLLGKDATGLRLFINLVVAFLPAAIVGLALKSLIEQHLFHPGPVLGALFIGGVVMIVIGPWQRKHFQPRAAGESEDANGYVHLDSLSVSRALIIGLVQCLALWPGTSRSMVTIVAAMLVGLRPRHAAEFSFLLGLPTLGGACCYSLYKDLSGDQPDMFHVLGWTPIVIGIIVAGLSAAAAIAWLVRFLTRHGVAVFGWYRVVLCLVLLALIQANIVSISPALEKEADSAETGRLSIPEALRAMSGVDLAASALDA